MNAEIDISNVVLRTERLILRPWRESDLDDFFGYASVDGVTDIAVTHCLKGASMPSKRV